MNYVSVSQLLERYGFSRTTLLTILSRPHYDKYLIDSSFFVGNPRSFYYDDSEEFNSLLIEDLSKIQKKTKKNS